MASQPLKVHVLFVDDEIDMHAVFKIYFEHEIEQNLIKASFSSSARECLEFLKSDEGCDIVLVLSDVNMPGMSGIEMLPYVIKSHTQVLVYIVTAYDSPQLREQAFKEGAARFFTKPIRFGELKTAMRTDLGIPLNI